MNRIMCRLSIAVLVVAGVAAWALADSSRAFAQDMPKATKRENVIYYNASFTKFKPGRADEGYLMIYEHFVPVDNAIGRKVETFDFQTGEWDHVVFFPLSEGVGEWGWITSPTDSKWWAAFVKREGGADKARAMMRKFNDMVATSKRQMAHRHLPPVAK